MNCLKINKWKRNRDIFLTFCMPGAWIRRRGIFEPATVATVRVIVLHPPSCNLLRFDVQRTALSAPRFKEYRVPFVSEARPEATYNWPKVCPWQFSFLYLAFASVLLVRAAPRLALFPRIFPSPGLSLHPLSLRGTNRRNCSALVDMTRGTLPRQFPTTPYDSFEKAAPYNQIDDGPT